MYNSRRHENSFILLCIFQKRYRVLDRLPEPCSCYSPVNPHPMKCCRAQDLHLGKYKLRVTESYHAECFSAVPSGSGNWEVFAELALSVLHRDSNTTRDFPPLRIKARGVQTADSWYVFSRTYELTFVSYDDLAKLVDRIESLRHLCLPNSWMHTLTITKLASPLHVFNVIHSNGKQDYMWLSQLLFLLIPKTPGLAPHVRRSCLIFEGKK